MSNFMPNGDELKQGTLIKATLRATEGSDMKEIEVNFNPKELRIAKHVPWQKHQHIEGDNAVLEFTAAEPKILTCELLFDLFEDAGDVRAEYISRLERLALIDVDLKRPPLCMFAWAETRFKGVVEDLDVTYTLFLPNGTPCRATVKLQMKEAVKSFNKQEAEAHNKEAEAQKKNARAQKGNAHTGAFTGKDATKAMNNGARSGLEPDSRGVMEDPRAPSRDASVPAARPPQAAAPGVGRPPRPMSREEKEYFTSDTPSRPSPARAPYGGGSRGGLTGGVRAGASGGFSSGGGATASFGFSASANPLSGVTGAISGAVSSAKGAVSGATASASGAASSASAGVNVSADVQVDAGGSVEG